MSVLADIFLTHKLYYSKNCKGDFVWGDRTATVSLTWIPLCPLQPQWSNVDTRAANHDAQAGSKETIFNFNQFNLLCLLVLKASLVNLLLKICHCCFKLANKARIFH